MRKEKVRRLTNFSVNRIRRHGIVEGGKISNPGTALAFAFGSETMPNGMLVKQQTESFLEKRYSVQAHFSSSDCSRVMR
jgi:hypothetical protein